MSGEPEVKDSPTAWVNKHIQQYEETNGETGGTFYGVPSLLLTTIGRKTGNRIRTALYYDRFGDAYVVVASSGGAANHPQWYLNLDANPEVEVQVMADKFDAIARTATPAEREILWPQVVKLFPQYAVYQTKTEREIPLVVLDRK
ncbi:nitroreductase family deazaflavin-dependent oxidoreductase [soil metagenome]